MTGINFRGFTQHLGLRLSAKRRIFAKRSALGAGFTIRHAYGFTVIELLLATAVFATVIVVAMAGFLGIGRIFYKGVNLTQSKQTAQKILDIIGADIQSAPTPVSHNSASGSRQYYCVGHIRYTYRLNNIINLSDWDSTNKFALMRDSLPGSSGCANPYDGADKIAPQNPSELLGNYMRLNKLDITPVTGDNTYSLTVSIVTGDDSVLDASGACNTNLAKSQYCAQTELSTIVSRGL